MSRKECVGRAGATRWSVPAMLIIAAAWPGVCLAAPPTVRLWPTAVVVGDQVRLGDLCELAGFDAELHEQLRTTVVVSSPPPGGSTAITLGVLRGVLTGAGVNMAETIVKGATECGVRRPRVLPVVQTGRAAAQQQDNGPQSPAPATLRDVVVEFFEHELSRYDGRPQVDFGREAAALLELSGPDYTFEIRRRSNRPLGLIDLEIDVLREGRRVQQVELQPVVILARRVVVARRAINQGAQVKAEDLHLTEMTFDRLDRLGLADLNQVIGQRSRRFIRPATMLDPRDLEMVPLVERGQLVTVRSTIGSVVVETAAKATEPGGFGDTIELRDTRRRGRRLIGVVTAPRQVELRGGGGVAPDRGPRLARAGGER